MSRMRRDGIELCMNESLPDAKEDPAAVISENGQVKVTLKSSKILDNRCGPLCSRPRRQHKRTWD